MRNAPRSHGAVATARRRERGAARARRGRGRDGASRRGRGRHDDDDDGGGGARGALWELTTAAWPRGADWTTRRREIESSSLQSRAGGQGER
jgi:hypothetical protein